MKDWFSLRFRELVCYRSPASTSVQQETVSASPGSVFPSLIPCMSMFNLKEGYRTMQRPNSSLLSPPSC